MAKFNYILNDLALINLVTRNLYSKNVCREDKEELENQIKLIMQENQSLKERINKLQKELNEENLQCSKYAIEFNDQKEKNKQLKDNWDELKKYIHDFPNIGYSSFEKINGMQLSGKLIRVDYLIDKMQELEKGDSNEFMD